MARKTTEKEAAEKAEGFEIPIDEESAGKVLGTIYKSALNGVPKVSRSVDEMVADYMGKAKSPDEAAKALAKWQGMKLRYRAWRLDHTPGRHTREHK